MSPAYVTAARRGLSRCSSRGASKAGSRQGFLAIARKAAEEVRPVPCHPPGSLSSFTRRSQCSAASFPLAEAASQRAVNFLPDRATVTAERHGTPSMPSGAGRQRENGKAVLADVRIAIGGYPPPRHLATIRSPVTCAYGTRSQKYMAGITRSLASAIPGASVLGVDGAGHAIAFDPPDGLVKVIVEALVSHGGGAANGSLRA
jgi:pimeloyl-ACP methyl ester carboxylesterase